MSQLDQDHDSNITLYKHGVARILKNLKSIMFYFAFSLLICWVLGVLIEELSPLGVALGTEDVTQDSISKTHLNATRNLSNNDEDSVYSQIASFRHNVYLVWEQSLPGPDAKNYDIYFMSSKDGGINFNDPVNLSNNKGFSEHPQIAAVENNVYVLWADDTSGTRQVYFRGSTDGGESFAPAVKLSKDNSTSFNAELTATGSKVTAVWNDNSSFGGNKIILAESRDRGLTFENIKNLGSSDSQSFPKVVAFKDQNYVTWNTNTTEDKSHQIIFTEPATTSTNLPVSPVKIANYLEDGESQISAFDDNVLIFWTGSNSTGQNNLYYTQSIDYGKNFGQIVDISENLNDSSNVETVFDGKNLYVAWQENVSGNEEIFLRKSVDGGVTFGQIINVSDNEGTSECPSISISNNKLHIVWEDDTLENHEIFYKSIDK